MTQGQASAANHAGDNALREDLRNLKEDLGQLKEDFGAALKDAREAAARGLDDLRGKAGGYAEQTSEKAGEFWEQVKAGIEENPVRTVAIAVGAGVLLGVLLRR